MSRVCTVMSDWVYPSLITPTRNLVTSHPTYIYNPPPPPYDPLACLAVKTSELNQSTCEAEGEVLL